MGKKQDALKQLEPMYDMLSVAEQKAAAGDAESQYQCFMIYNAGAVVPRDEKKALAYLRQAAAQYFMRSRELLASYEAH